MTKANKNPKKSPFDKLRAGKKWLIYLILGGFLFELFKLVFKNIDGLKGFIKEEKREINELENKEEGILKFCTDTKCLFKQYFIPHKDNDHKPKFLRPKSLTTIVVLLLLLKFSVVGLLFLTHPQGAQVSEAVVQRILELTNQERRNEKLTTLAMNPVLNASALAKANDMIARNYFAHYAPDGKKPWDFIDRGAYRYIYIGENLGMNFTTADSVHKALMASPTHKKNIMNERYKDIGLAMVSGMINGKETNLLVQFFGSNSATLAAASAPAAVPTPTPAPPTPVEVAGEEQAVPEEASNKSESPNEAPKEKPSEPKVESIEELKKDPSSAEATEGKPKTITIEKEKTESMIAQTEEEKIAKLPALSEAERPNIPDPAVTQLTVSQNIAAQTPVVRIKNTDSANLTSISRVLKIVNYIFATVMAILILALIVNIVVRLEVQHKPVIIQTLAVILLVGSFWFFKWHHLEAGIAEILLL